MSIAASTSMLRLAGFLVVVLSSAAVDAAPKRAPAKRPAAAAVKPRVQVVKVSPASGEAVLLQGTEFQTVSVGETFGGYTLIEVDEAGVTVGAGGKTFVLATMSKPPKVEKPAPAIAPITPTGPAPAPPTVTEAPTPATESIPPTVAEHPTPTPTPTPPAADPKPAGATGAPADPYADEPLDPYSDATKPPPTKVAGPEKPAVGPSKPAVGPQKAQEPEPLQTTDAKAPAPLVTIEVTRRDIDAALEDFGSLLVAVTGELTKDGAKLEQVTEGSLFARLGIRAGDTITTVDNKPLRSLDDAADLYARAGTIRVVTAQVLRAGKPFTLRVVIK